MSRIFFLIALFLNLVSCNCKTNVTKDKEITEHQWQKQFDEILPLLGHRNLILVVDKAYPLQGSKGMQYINSNDDLLPVLNHVLGSIQKSTHVKPIIYRDTELSKLTEQMVPGVGAFKTASDSMCMGFNTYTILHEEVFSKMEQAAQLFTVVVIKTNTTIPYSSHFIELDCKYWSSEKEEALRSLMKKNSTESQ